MSVKDLIVLKSSMATNLSSGKYGPTLSKREITNPEKSEFGFWKFVPGVSDGPPANPQK